MGLLLSQVFAFNSVGRSEPAVVMVNPTLSKRGTTDTRTDEPEYQPEYPQETLLCTYSPSCSQPIATSLIHRFIASSSNCQQTFYNHSSKKKRKTIIVFCFPHRYPDSNWSCTLCCLCSTGHHFNRQKVFCLHILLERCIKDTDFSFGIVASHTSLDISHFLCRRRQNRNDSTIYDEIPSQELFFQAKNLNTQNNGTQTRSCAVQVSDVPMDRVLNYAILTQNHVNPTEMNASRPNGYYASNQLNGLNDEPSTPHYQPKCRLKKSDSISSYTRYDDVDTDCEDYMHNSSDDVLQTSHLDIPKTAVRFSPRLDDRKTLSKRIPIFPIENERIYCVVDIDRYKLHPNDLHEHERLSPVY